MRLVQVRDTAGVLMALGIGIIPVYVFPSGALQPAHLVLALFAGLYLLATGIPRAGWAALLAFLAFYVFALEGVYAFMGGDPRHMINGAFLAYNCAFAVAVFSYVRRKGPDPIPLGMSAASLLAVLTVAVSGVNLQELGETGRETATFNNPNQLGYFSVCVLSLTYLMYRLGSIRYVYALILFGAALYLSIVSLSKAALVANLAVILFALVPRRSRWGQVAWAFGGLVVFGAVSLLVSRGAFDDYLFMQRLSSIAMEGDSSFESRGYFAILQANAAELIFGLGSETVLRIVGHEVHSTFAAMLNNYGVVGFVLFGGVMFYWVTRVWSGFGFLGMLCIVGPAMLYGLTHYGGRFTLFWLLVAASLAVSSVRGAPLPPRWAKFSIAGGRVSPPAHNPTASG